VRHLKTSTHERDLQQRQVAKTKMAVAEAGLPLLDTPTHILPVVVGEPQACNAATDRPLAHNGIYLQLNYPTVPRGSERLRILPNAALPIRKQRQ